jgi:phage baseplate assembly protein gpV
MIEFISEARIDHEILKAKFGDMVKVGPVAEVDPQKGYRINLGDGDDGPLLSPWMPHPESAGVTKSWMPLSVGQIVGVLSPNGDLAQGVLVRGGFGGGNGQPSSGLSENVLEAFGIRLEMKDGILTIKAGNKVQVDSDIEVDGDVLIKGNLTVEGNFSVKGLSDVGGGVDFKGPYVRHHGTNIGNTHVHTGVQPGGSNTQHPR